MFANVRWIGLDFRSFRVNGWGCFDVIDATGALQRADIDRFASRMTVHWTVYFELLWTAGLVVAEQTFFC